MASERSVHASRQDLLRRALVLGVVMTLAIPLAACGERRDADSPESASTAEFDPLAMSWSPRVLQDAAPCLVGWRSDGVSGELVALAGDKASDPAIWRTPPDVGDVRVSLIGVDPYGQRMVGEAFSQTWGEEPTQRALIFESDGTVREFPRPEGYEGVADVTFIEGGVVAVAYHATLEEYQTAMGLVAPGGEWTPLALSGDVPDYLFIDGCFARPGSDLVGLVLKVAGGVADRDDYLLVLARLEGATLTVVTPPFYDDSLEYARALWTADGAQYPRMWTAVDGAFAPTPLRVEWTGSEWLEREVLPPGAVAVGVETGQVLAEDASGGEWIRDAAADAHGADSAMVYLAPGATAPAPTDVQLGDVDWFAWVEDAEE